MLADRAAEIVGRSGRVTHLSLRGLGRQSRASACLLWESCIKEVSHLEEARSEGHAASMPSLACKIPNSPAPSGAGAVRALLRGRLIPGKPVQSSLFGDPPAYRRELFADRDIEESSLSQVLDRLKRFESDAGPRGGRGEAPFVPRDGQVVRDRRPPDPVPRPHDHEFAIRPDAQCVHGILQGESETGDSGPRTEHREQPAFRLHGGDDGPDR